MSVVLALQLKDAQADDERIDYLTSELRDELLGLDVEDVTRPSAGRAPAGARAIDIAAVGALLLTVQQSADALSHVLTAVREWLKRDPEPARTVKLTLGDRSIELSGASSEQQDLLIAEFVRATAEGDGGGR